MPEVIILEDSSWYHRSYRRGERVVVGAQEYWDLDRLGRVELVRGAPGKPVRAAGPFEGRHAGEVIAVLGNGPSIGRMDLSTLKRVTTIGTNRISLVFDTDYLVWLDGVFQEQCADLIASSRAEKFAAAKIHLAHPYHRFGKYIPKRGQPMLSSNFTDGLYWSFTSVFPAISLAYIFGAAAIILVGVDLLDNSHFYSRRGSDAPFASADRILKDFRKLSQFAEESGIEIYSTSESSAVECFPRAGLGGIIGRMKEDGKLLKRF